MFDDQVNIRVSHKCVACTLKPSFSILHYLTVLWMHKMSLHTFSFIITVYLFAVSYLCSSLCNSATFQRSGCNKVSGKKSMSCFVLCSNKFVTDNYHLRSSFVIVCLCLTRPRVRFAATLVHSLLFFEKFCCTFNVFHTSIPWTNTIPPDLGLFKTFSECKCRSILNSVLHWDMYSRVHTFVNVLLSSNGLAFLHCLWVYFC